MRGSSVGEGDVLCPHVNILILHVHAEIPMDSYVIRIYQWDEEDPGRASGQVELVEQGRVKSFTCADELVKILGLKGRRAPTQGATKSRAGRGSNTQGRKKP